MSSRFPLALASMATLVVSACATDGGAGSPQPDAGPAQREYRTGSRFPVKESTTPMTQQERDRQLEEARAAAQSRQSSSGAPRGAPMGQ